MRGVQLDPVEAGLAGAAGAVGEEPTTVGDLLLGRGLAEKTVEGVRCRRLTTGSVPSVLDPADVALPAASG